MRRIEADVYGAAMDENPDVVQAFLSFCNTVRSSSTAIELRLTLFFPRSFAAILASSSSSPLTSKPSSRSPNAVSECKNASRSKPPSTFSFVSSLPPLPR